MNAVVGVSDGQDLVVVVENFALVQVLLVVDEVVPDLDDFVAVVDVTLNEDVEVGFQSTNQFQILSCLLVNDFFVFDV